jgi:metal-responsive CopG/Arc/MetJ family transcriptional regulator
MHGEGVNTTGVVMILHYIDRPELVGEVNGILRLHRGLFRSMSQFFVGENKMLEVVAVEGEINEVRDLVQELMAVKGVKQVKSSFLTP